MTEYVDILRPPPMTEYVDILTAGGRIIIDATATEENGMFDREAETADDVIAAVKQDVANGNTMIDAHGCHILVLPGAPLAYTYRLGEHVK